MSGLSTLKMRWSRRVRRLSVLSPRNHTRLAVKLTTDNVILEVLRFGEHWRLSGLAAEVWRSAFI